MLVPEAAMNQDHPLAAYEGEVGRAREVAAVRPIPIPSDRTQRRTISSGLVADLWVCDLCRRTPSGTFGKGVLVRFREGDFCAMLC